MLTTDSSGPTTSETSSGRYNFTMLRVATWNLERPKSNERSWKKTPGQRELMQELTADIWVVTEGRRDYLPVDGFHGVHSPPEGAPRDDIECLSAVWVPADVRLIPLEEPAPVPRGSVAAMVETSALGTVIVYASVIAYAAERRHIDGTKAAKNWEVHLREIERQSKEWAALRDAHPSVPLIVAGDLNMNLAGPHWYGTAAGRDLLRKGLKEAGLRCVTDVDVTASGQLPGKQLVDHICVSDELDLVGHIETRAPDLSGVKLSDHPAVAATLARR